MTLDEALARRNVVNVDKVPGLGTYVTFRVSRDSVPTRTYLFAPSAIDVFETVGEVVLEL